MFSPLDERQAVIEALADSEAALLAEVASVSADRDSWRLVALTALSRMADLARQVHILGRRRAHEARARAEHAHARQEVA